VSNESRAASCVDFELRQRCFSVEMRHTKTNPVSIKEHPKSNSNILTERINNEP
jgi:hypothetical protein